MQKWVEDECGIERLKQLNSTFVMDVLSSIQQMQSTSPPSSGSKSKNGKAVLSTDDSLVGSNGSLDGNINLNRNGGNRINQAQTESFIKMEIPSFEADEVESPQARVIPSPPASICGKTQPVKSKIKSEPSSVESVAGSCGGLKPPNLARHETLVYPAPKVVSTANLPASPVPIITSANPKSMKS